MIRFDWSPEEFLEIARDIVPKTLKNLYKFL
jgi:hypothetical protein